MIAGLLLWAIPVPMSFPSRTFESSSKFYWGENVSVPSSPGEFSSQIKYSASWSTSGGLADSADQLRVYDCGYHPKCADSVFQGYPMTMGMGSAGTITWTGGRGELFELNPGILTTNMTVAVSYSEQVAGGVVGLGLTLSGVAVAVVGLVTRREIC